MLSGVWPLFSQSVCVTMVVVVVDDGVTGYMNRQQG